MRLIAGRMFLWLVLGLMLAWGSPAVSQTQTGATSGQKVEPNIFDGFALRLEQIATALNREGVSSTELTGYRDEILSIQAKAQAEITSVQPKLDEVNARLSQLGDPPENDADELEEVAMQRELLTLSADANDEGTNALMSDYIRAQEKLVWMYSAFLGR